MSKFIGRLRWKLNCGSFFFFYYLLSFFFYFTILYWFCCTSTWICHGRTRVPHPEPPSHLSPCTIPLGHPSAPAPSILYHGLAIRIVDLKWYYTVICLENGETPDWAVTMHRYLSKLVLDLTHLWLNLGYQTCISFLLKFWKCFGDFDQVLLNLLLVSTLRHSL